MCQVGSAPQLRDVNAYTSLSMTYMSAGSITPEGKVWAHVPADIGECWDDTCAWVWLPNMIVSVKESIITYHVQPVVLEVRRDPLNVSIVWHSLLPSAHPNLFTRRNAQMFDGIATGWRMMAAAVLIRRARGKLGCCAFWPLDSWTWQPRQSCALGNLASCRRTASPHSIQFPPTSRRDQRHVRVREPPLATTAHSHSHNLIAPSRSPPQREFNHSDYLRFHVAWLSASQSYRFPCHRRSMRAHQMCPLLRAMLQPARGISRRHAHPDGPLLLDFSVVIHIIV
ncbi:hypothetical protein BD779DRAFT_1476648 [Infundibulicybe gibba]|nr:hypothetical protein BD779DRAFT_1476648 [Infundibulicybe gibba]